MEEKIYSKKKLNNKKVALVSLALLIIYVLYAVFLLTNEQAKVFTIEKSKLYLEETNIGYVIRNEKVVKGENYKNGMEQIKTEGEKVSVNESVFRYYSQNENELKQKIAELDVQVQKAMQENENINRLLDVKNIENQIDQKVFELNKQTDNSKIGEYKKEINELVYKKAKIVGENSKQGSYLKDLINERAKLEASLNSGAEYVKSPISGIVSYRVDGLEETLTTNNLDSLTEEYLNNLNLKTGKIVATSDECGKIIDNFSCYIVTTSSTEQAQTAKIGDKVKVRISTNSEIDAKITNIKQEDNGKYLLILEINKGITELSNYRKISFDLIWLSYSGFKVPNQAIVEKDGLTYVVRKRAGYETKVLVKISQINEKDVKNEKYTIIRNYKSDELQELGWTTKEINSYKGISLYDEIIINPDISKIE